MCSQPLFISRHVTPPADGIPILDVESKRDITGWYVPCGKCLECARRRKNDWYIRLRRDIESTKAKSVWWCTFTFDEVHLPADKAQLALSVRRFKDNVRKALGYFPKHWMISERGETGRIHFHGFLFLKDFTHFETIRNAWKNGFCWLEEIKSLKAVTYALKYALKGILDRIIDDDQLAGRIYCTQGLGGEFLNPQSLRFIWNESSTTQYRTFCPAQWTSGFQYAMPRYYIYRAVKYLRIRKYQSVDDWLKTIEEGQQKRMQSNALDNSNTLLQARQLIIDSFNKKIRKQYV